MHASVAALRGRTKCSSRQAQSQVLTPDPLWADWWPLLEISVRSNLKPEYQAQIQEAEFDQCL